MNLIKIMVYLNIWLSIAFICGHISIMKILNRTLSWEYLFVGALGIQFAYGLDNIIDWKYDSNNWKNEVKNILKSKLGTIYYSILVSSLIFASFLIFTEVKFQKYLLFLIIISGLSYSIPFNSKWYKFNIQRIPFFKSAFISLVWFIYLLGVPFKNDETFYIQKGIQIFFLIFPSLLTAVVLTDYREERYIKNKVLSLRGAFSIDQFFKLAIVFHIFFYVISCFIYPAELINIFVIYLVNLIVIFIYRTKLSGFIKEMSADSLGGIYLFLLLVLSGKLNLI